MSRLKHNKLHQVYYLLASLDLLAIGTSVLINHYLTNQFKKTVEVTELLSKHLVNIEQLQVLASAVNAPGNEVFDSDNVESEVRRYREKSQDFDRTYSGFLSQLSSQVHDLSLETVLQVSQRIPEKMAVMKKDADLVFSLFSSGDRIKAASQMAKMDRSYAGLRLTLIECNQIIRGLQRDFLNEQKEQSEHLQVLEIIFSSLILIMILGALYYGRAMSGFVSNSLREKKLAEEQKNALDASAIVAVTDLKGKITYINDKFVEISGFQKSELLGKDHRLINSGTHPREFFSELWKTIRSGQIWRGEVRNKRKDGSYYWVDSTIVPMRDDKNEVFQYIAIRHEITNRKILEEKLISAIEEAQAASKAKATFLANMSHEIRTPLNGVLGMASLLSEEALSAEGRRHLEIMRNSGDSLLVLLNDILDFSKIEAGKLELERLSFCLEETINEVVSLLQFRAKEKGLDVSFQMDPNLPKFISCDVTRFRQVLTNLVSNAIKFTQAGSVKVSARLGSKEDKALGIQVDVVDTGPGMTFESQAALFKPFSQVDASTTRRFGGTGLGLSISRGICEAMGGSIWVKSSLGEGSTFSFTFLAEVADSIPSKMNQRRDDADADLAKKNPLRILVADDHSTNQLIAKKFLEKLGYNPDVVANGLEVLRSMELKTYDVILMDGHMPELDGYETTKRIRLINPQWPWIITFSASITQEDRRHSQESGMNDFLAKPVNLSALEAVLKRVPSRPKEEKTARVQTQRLVNKEALLRHFAGDEDVMTEIIKNFLLSAHRLVTAIESAVTAKDSKGLYQRAHKLKGSVANFFAEPVISTLEDLETLGHSGSFSEVDQRLKALRQDMEILCQELELLVIEGKAA